jgi:2-keto-4-pentenoate hydratase
MIPSSPTPQRSEYGGGSGPAGAAAILWHNWQNRTRIDELPPDCRPSDRAAAYLAQQEIVKVSGQPVVGWKIAATSAAGQEHIGVEGPLAGPLLAGRVLAGRATVPLDGNIMKVAEAEFAFTFAKGLHRRTNPYTLEEVLAAVELLHPAIEVPDSRYNDFARVGASQLIADTACGCWFVLGPPTTSDWRSRSLVTHTVTAYRNGDKAAVGNGSNVLGDPLVALAWLVNELRAYGDGIAAGQFVTTGTCIVPVPIAPGDVVRTDFGEFGSVEVCLS